jgi:hypothetical protein
MILNRRTMGFSTHEPINLGPPYHGLKMQEIDFLKKLNTIFKYISIPMKASSMNPCPCLFLK